MIKELGPGDEVFALDEDTRMIEVGTGGRRRLLG